MQRGAHVQSGKLCDTGSADTQKRFLPSLALLLGRRAEKQRLHTQLQAFQARAERAEAALEPLRAHVRELTAQVESHAEEVKSVRRAHPRRAHLVPVHLISGSS